MGSKLILDSQVSLSPLVVSVSYFFFTFLHIGVLVSVVSVSRVRIHAS